MQILVIDVGGTHVKILARRRLSPVAGAHPARKGKRGSRA
jgi:hypothetical protein